MFYRLGKESEKRRGGGGGGGNHPPPPTPPFLRPSIKQLLYAINLKY